MPIKDIIINLFRLKNRLKNLFRREKPKQLKKEYLEILRIFLSIEKKKTIITSKSKKCMEQKLY